MYTKPIVKSLNGKDIFENDGPAQTAYAQVMWVQTDIINAYNYTVDTNQFADATIVRLEKKA